MSAGVYSDFVLGLWSRALSWGEVCGGVIGGVRTTSEGGGDFREGGREDIGDDGDEGRRKKTSEFKGTKICLLFIYSHKTLGIQMGEPLRQP